MLKKSSLPFKIASTSLVITMIGIIIVSFFNFKMSDKILSEHALKFLSKDVEEKKADFEQIFQNIRTSLLYLATSTESQDFLKPNQSQTDFKQSTSRLKSLFDVVLQQKPGFLEICLKDVRHENIDIAIVKKRSDDVTTLSKSTVSATQENIDFQKALKLTQGEVHFADVTLDKRESKLVLPYKAIFRVYAGLFGSDGNLAYLIEVKGTFKRFTHLLPKNDINHYYFLTNQYGDYLFHPQSEKSMGFALNKIEKFQNDFPYTSNYLSVMQTLSDHSNYSFKINKQGIVLSLSHMHIDPKDPSRIGIIGAVKKLSLLRAESDLLQRNLLFIMIIVSLILAFITYKMAKHISNPIISLKEATDKISNNKQDVIIPLGGYDEIYSLGKSFENLLSKLMKLQEELKHSNLTLEQQVTDRTSDLNDTKKALEIQNTKLNEALEQAKISSLSKDRFLAMMSHEIRTPLNGVLGLTELLLDTKLNSTQKENLETVHTSGEILLTILNDILDYSKMEAGKFDLNIQEFSLNDLLEHIVKLYAKDANQKNIELFTNSLPTLQHNLLGDPDRLCQIFMNLLSNSIKFTQTGEIYIQADLLFENEEDIKIRFNIIDSGIGIAKKDHDRLFCDFIQVDQTTSRTYGGTGLGLSIVRKLIRLMDGEIYLDSKENEGSHFWFDLTFHKGKKLKDCPYFYRESFLQHRTLLIDDCTKHQSSVKSVLSQWGATVDCITIDSNTIQKIEDEFNNTTPYHSIIISHGNSSLCPVQALQDINKTKLCPLQEILNLQSLTRYKDLSIISVSPCKKCQLIETDTPYNQLLSKPLSLKKLSDILLSNMGVKRSISYKQETQNTQRIENILIVEDVLVNQKVANGMLKKLCFQNISIAGDGIEALSFFEANHYDLILMDIQMPNMDGYEATKAIRLLEDPLEKRTPIIALTAHAFVTEKIHSKEIGMDDLLTKPLTLQSLKKVINTWLPDKKSIKSSSSDSTQQSIDPSIIKRLFEDMGEGIGDILDVYIEELPQYVQEICDCLVSKDSVAIKKSAHKLKGASRNFGVLNIIEICVNIEEKSTNIKSIDIPAVVQSLEAEKDKVLLAFKEDWVKGYR